MSATPARQVWASTLRGGTAVAEALSPDGTRLFVLGYVGPAVKSETVAYNAATGAQLWAKTYPPENTGGPDEMIAVSPDGAQVYVTGTSTGQGAVTIAYAAGTGRQLWVSHSKSVGLITGLAVSPDGTTVYETGSGRVSGKGSYIAVIAYDAATGQQRWLRYYTKVKPANGALGAVAVSPDGTTVYVAWRRRRPVALLVLPHRPRLPGYRHAEVGDPVREPLYRRRVCRRSLWRPHRARTRRERPLRRRHGFEQVRAPRRRDVSRFARRPARACGWTPTPRAAGKAVTP